MPEGVAKVRGESELNALKMYLRLERKFGSGVAVPTNIARRAMGLASMSFYRYLTLLEEADLVEWRKGSFQYKTGTRRVGTLSIRTTVNVDKEKALRLGLKALRASREERPSR